MRVVLSPSFSLCRRDISKEAVSKANLTSRGSITRPEAHEQEDSASVTKIKCNREKRREPYHLSDKQQEQSHLIVPPTDITVLLEVCLVSK